MSGDSKLVNRNKAKAGNAVVGDKNTKDKLVGFSQSNEVHQENVIDISADTGEVIPSQDSTLGSDKTKDGHVEKTTNVDPKPSDNKQTEPDQPFDHVESMDEPLLDPTVTEGKATPSDDAKEVSITTDIPKYSCIF
eukprot:Pgem_evm1s6669